MDQKPKFLEAAYSWILCLFYIIGIKVRNIRIDISDYFQKLDIDECRGWSLFYKQQPPLTLMDIGLVSDFSSLYSWRHTSFSLLFSWTFLNYITKYTQKHFCWFGYFLITTVMSFIAQSLAPVKCPHCSVIVHNWLLLDLFSFRRATTLAAQDSVSRS